MRIKPQSIKQLETKRSLLDFKGKLLTAIRDFFAGESFLEVETPVMIKAPAPEEFIDAFSAGNRFLRTSPELEMKTMLAAGYKRIFQLGPCFRSGEQGKFHHEEFTMLEWYQAGIDYMELLDFTKRMLVFICNELFGRSECTFDNKIINFAGKWQIMTVEDAFKRFTETTLGKAIEDDCFEELLVDKIEPNLGESVPSVLIDYPAEHAGFAKLNNEIAERWELYIQGIETANACRELTDPIEHVQRFNVFKKSRKQNGLKSYPEPAEFLEVLNYGIPESSGCAMGIDRLAMILSDTPRIQDVRY